MARNKRNANRTMGNVNRSAMTMSEFAAHGFGDLEGLMEVEPGQKEGVVVRASDGRVIVGKFVLSPVGLELAQEELSVDEWMQFGNWLSKFQDSIQWILGDWANLAAERAGEWGAKYDELLAQTDYSYSSLSKFAHYAKQIPFFRRRKNLSYSHHIEVVDLPEAEQDKWLEQAETDNLSVRQLREAIRGIDASKRLPPIEQFNKEWLSYEKKQRRLARRMVPHERQQMVKQLRRLAAEIEGMD